MAGEQDVPIDPLKGQLGHVVETRFPEQRQRPDVGLGTVTRQWLGVVVEVDQQRLVKAGLDEAVGVAVVGAVQRQPVEVAGRCSRPASRPRNRRPTDPALEVGTLVASPIANTLGAAVLCNASRDRSGANPRSSPSEGERPTNGAPPCSGTATSRSKSSSRSSQLVSLPELHPPRPWRTRSPSESPWRPAGRSGARRRPAW